MSRIRAVVQYTFSVSQERQGMEKIIGGFIMVNEVSVVDKQREKSEPHRKGEMLEYRRGCL